MTRPSPRLGLWLGVPLAVGIGLAAGYLFDLPDVRPLRNHPPGPTAYMRLAERKAAAKGRPWRLRQTWVPLKDISPNLIHAVLISEDAGFYSHGGVDFEELKVAIDMDIAQRSFGHGASTITQQLARNLYLSPAKNPLRKLKELLIAFRLEKYLRKSRILELYLNVAQWGDGLYGAEAASQAYFGKPASALAPEEAAALATALPNPRRFLPTRDAPFLARRRRVLLQRMRQLGYIHEELTAAPTAQVLLPVEVSLSSASAAPEEPDEDDDQLGL